MDTIDARAPTLIERQMLARHYEEEYGLDRGNAGELAENFHVAVWDRYVCEGPGGYVGPLMVVIGGFSSFYSV